MAEDSGIDKQTLLNMTGPVGILLRLTFPFICAAIFIFTLYLILPWEMFSILIILMAGYFVPPAGKETIIPAGIALGLPWYLIGTALAMMDVLCALFMVLNFDLVLKIPFFGDKLVKGIIDNGESFFEKHAWIKRLSSIGLAIFVMIPLQGSGGLTTPVIGRILGIPYKDIFIAVVVGAFAGCYILAIGVEYIVDILKADIILGIITIIIIAAALVSSWFVWKKNKNKWFKIENNTKTGKDLSGEDNKTE